MTETDNRKTLCVDFDGVLHSYTSGWKGADVIPDPPVDGALRWLHELVLAGFRVCIYSSRSKEPGGVEAMREWLVRWGWRREEVLRALEFPTQKPAAFLTIDDRAFCFRGVFPTPEEIREFKTWQQ